MLSYLSQQTGDNYIIVSTRNYQQMIQFLAEGKINIASISPVPYVLAKNINPALQLLVTELSWDENEDKLSDTYQGFIITLKANEHINSLDDLRQKRFGFVKRESSSGYNYPKALLEAGGIQYKNDFGRYYFLGSHPRVTDAIASGSIDAGATSDYNLKRAIEKHGDIFKILLTTERIPNICIAAHPPLSKNKIKQLQYLLTHIQPELLDGLSAQGYVIRKDSFYNIVRRVSLEK